MNKPLDVKKNLMSRLPLWILRVTAISSLTLAIFLIVASYKIAPNEVSAQCTPIWTASGCSWLNAPAAARPNWSTATCPGGKVARGFGCQWSDNSQEQSELELGPNYFRCRYVANGGTATARAYCCDG